jgi:DNA primase
MEGFMDVIKADIFGIENCVAAMGTAFTDEQARKLRRATDQIFICFDGDKAGQNAALSSIRILRKFNFNIKVVNLKDGLDPDDFLAKYGKEEFLKALDNAKNVVEFQINKLYKEADLTSEETKAKFLKDSFAIIRTIGDDMAENLYLNRLSTLLNIDAKIVLNSYDKNKVETPTIIRQEEPEIVQSKRIITASERAEHIILAAMLNNKATAVKFEQDLGYLLTKEYDALAHYIISFYKKYDTIIEANFISYLEDNKDIIEAFTSVVNSVEEVFLSPQSVLGCMNKIKEYSVYKMVEELQQKIESTLDEDEKLEYANKKFELQRKIKKY